jgi:hypothetical protein
MLPSYSGESCNQMQDWWPTALQLYGELERLAGD